MKNLFILLAVIPVFLLVSSCKSTKVVVVTTVVTTKKHSPELKYEYESEIEAGRDLGSLGPTLPPFVKFDEDGDLDDEALTQALNKKTGKKKK